MEKKTLSKITVTDIVKDCGFNRKTFYYHFQDVPALLKWTLEQGAVNVVKKFDLLNELEEALRFTVHYIRENCHMISCAYDAIGRDELKRSLNHNFSSIVLSLMEQIEQQEQVTVEADYRNIICNFYTEGIAGELVELLKSKNASPEQDEKRIHCLSVLVRTSLAAAVKQYK